MILRNIKLDNIRSYISQEISFPEGSVLLSGDIGTGKSTVLLAIEFALFGISKGYLSGNSLLRNGKDKGSVYLEFKINNKDVAIKRNLKRSGNVVSQDYGYISIDGKKQELSALELKQAVLDLLNYPPESLTKSKSLIYRYTVYTPQEEMKQILTGDKEIRLDALRRIFGIDKYRTIKENTKIFLSYIKNKKKELETLISTLPQKEEEKLNMQQSLSEFESNLNTIDTEINTLKSELKIKSSDLKVIEYDIKKFNQLKNELDIKETNLKNKLNERKNLIEEIEELKNYIEKIDLKEELDLNILSDQIKSKENEIKLLGDSLSQISYKVSSFDVSIKNSEKIGKDIFILKKCPVCHQDVSEAHKEHINSLEESKIKEAQENKKIYVKREKEARTVLESLKREVSELEGKKYEVQLIQIKIKNNKEKESKINKLNNNLKMIRKEIGLINSKKLELQKELEKFMGLEESYSSVNEELEYLREKNIKIEIQKSRLETQISELNRQLSKLNKEINKQSLLKQKLNNLININAWLELNFIKLIENIESHIMLKINTDFNDLFERWFNMLVESENLNIRLDDLFTPIIDQNGYEIEYENLSGGEKTAAALAYRLSLNQVINMLVSIINTKDIIILDEPTDGFSEDQLDKIRIVLNELKTKQTIIVSHESKIESFVDAIVRFNKKNHISEVIF